MPKLSIFEYPFSKVYPLYVQKAAKKHRTQEEVDAAICWLTGYTQEALEQQIHDNVDLKTFFAQAPCIHPNRTQITGLICGIRVEDIPDPLMQNIRYMDKLIDELAQGKPLSRVLRS